MSESEDTPPSVVQQPLPDDPNEDQHQMVIAGPSNRQTAPIFMLNVDCCDEIFDYLSIKDLHSFGQTSNVAGEYFKKNCAGAQQYTKGNGTYIGYSDHEGASDELTQISGFNRYITDISFYSEELSSLHYVEFHSDEFDSVNNLILLCAYVNELVIKHFRKILLKIEHIKLYQCRVLGCIYDILLKYCINMTALYIYDDLSCVIGSETNPWLLQHYPMLKHLKLFGRHERAIQGLTTFFKQNPNVQRFSVSLDQLWPNRHQLINSNIKLDVLDVWDTQFRKIEDEHCDLLKELHDRGFFKRLYIKLTRIYETCDQIVLLPGLERLHICETVDIFNVSRMIGLKELYLPGGFTTNDIETLAANLVNLVEVVINTRTSDDLLPFMRYSKQLRKLYPQLNGILNLSKLNKEREKLVNARKVIIYVEDNIFLATKWKIQYGDANMELVEMQRDGSRKYRKYC